MVDTNSQHERATPSTANGRAPDFLIVGAAKAGTTSLARWLSDHPSVFVPARKEVHYFDWGYDQGWPWYLSQFTAGEGFQVVGEATPGYMYTAGAAERMAADVPDAKLIALLRNPVDRAYSHYWYLRRHQDPAKPVTNVSFEAMIADPAAETRFGLLARGRYLGQLQHLCELYPREHLLVMLFDDLVSDPEAVLARTCRFLGVDDTVQPESLYQAHNANDRWRSHRVHRVMERYHVWARWPRAAAVVQRANTEPFVYPKISPETRASLLTQFADDNAALSEWLGVDLSSWST